MIGPDRTPHERHLRFVGRLAALAIIAPQARTYKIFPGVLTAPALRHDMIDGQRDRCRPAILATVSIAPQDILARENDLFERHSNIGRKSNNTRKWHRHGSRVDCPARHCAYELGFIEIEQHDRLFDTANGKRLVVAVQDQYFTAQCRMGGIKIVIVEVVVGKARRMSAGRVGRK